MATAHLLHGFLGAGKTTFARKLEAERPAIRFTPDAWMTELFGPDPPAADFPRHAEALAGLLAHTWRRCLRLGVDVVLDYGFWTRAERDAVRAAVTACGAEAILYRLSCDEALARRRVAARNDGPDRSLYVASATFDLLKARFEPLHPDEARMEVAP